MGLSFHRRLDSLGVGPAPELGRGRDEVVQDGRVERLAPVLEHRVLAGLVPAVRVLPRQAERHHVLQGEEALLRVLSRVCGAVRVGGRRALLGGAQQAGGRLQGRLILRGARWVPGRLAVRRYD